MGAVTIKKYSNPIPFKNEKVEALTTNELLVETLSMSMCNMNIDKIIERAQI